MNWSTVLYETLKLTDKMEQSTTLLTLKVLTFLSQDCEHNVVTLK